MSIIKKVLKYYNKIPVSFLNIIAPLYHCLPDNLKYTSYFIKEKRELDRIDSLSTEDIEKERNLSVQKLINYSYEHVPYYHKLFDKNSILPSDIRTVSDLSKIPYLTKELLANNQEELISDEYHKKDLVYITTSGSTGNPVGFYVQKESHIRDWVYVFHMFNKYGYNQNSSKLMLRGKVFQAQCDGKSWQWDAFKRELSINIFDMTQRNMEEYCLAIEKHKPEFAYGYMSAMYTFCKFLSQRKTALKHQFRGFIGISETITDEQRIFVESVIGAPVLTFYGMSERVIIAAETAKDHTYSIEPLYGIAELIDENEKLITEKNIKGELVGTSLLNYGMPLIRYKMGDISSWAGKDILSKIEGRWNHDQLVGRDLCLISMTALNMHSEVFKKVNRYQLFQDTPGKVIIKVVKNSDFMDLDKERIEKQFTEKAKNQIDFKVELVDEIKPKTNGKLFLVEQKLDLRKIM